MANMTTNTITNTTKKMTVPLLDLKAQYQALRSELEPTVLNALAEAHYIMGPQVKNFEKEVQEFCQVKYAIGCANGSDALRLALMAAQIQPGDEVIIPTYTFFATAGAVALMGAIPVFCDIDSDTYNIDPTKIEQLITKKTKAIIPVHLYGQMADMDFILDIANKHHLTVIEDGAQAIGATYKDRSMGNCGHMATLSFFPSKNLGAAGDAGMILTNNSELAERLQVLRLHGSKPKYYHQMIGFNSRLDTIQAAILSIKLKHLKAWTDSRRKNACSYMGLFSELERREILHCPQTAPYTTRHVYNQFVISVKSRDALQKHLNERGIGTEIYYPLPLHAQKCFDYLKVNPALYPRAVQASQETLALPIYPELTKEQMDYVAESVQEFFQ